MAQQKKKTFSPNTQKEHFVFGKLNYQLLLASITVVILGFILMYGKEDIYSFTKITLAPIIVVAGFALGFVAILKDPNKKK